MVDRKTTLVTIASLGLGVSILQGCSPVIESSVFDGEKAIFRGVPQLEKPYELQPVNSIPNKPGVFLRIESFRLRTKEQILRLELVHSENSFPQANGSKVYICVQDARGRKVTPRNSQEDLRSEYGQQCARASKLSPITNELGEKFGRYKALFKTWQSRSSALKTLVVGIMYENRGLLKSYNPLGLIKTSKS